MVGLTIKAVAERTGVSIHTLRAWERRYGVPRPKRMVGNRYRLYDEVDIADVLWLKEQVEAGATPSQAGAMLRQQRAGGEIRALAAPESPFAAKRQALQTALVSSNELAVRQVLDEVFGLYAPEEIAREIIQPTMRALGEAWQRNEVTVWQEHLASNLLRQKLLAGMQTLPTPLPTMPHLVAACAPEEQHELGLLLFGLFARRQGWRVSYLGQCTPLEDVSRLSQGVKLIALSVTTLIGLASLVPLLSEINRPSALLVFGGYMFVQVPALRERVPGVFLREDPAQAVQALGTLKVPTEFWSAPVRGLNAAWVLRSQRLSLCSETIRRLASSVQSTSTVRALYAQSLAAPILFLTDALTSALAFDLPELMDMHGQWMNQTLPSSDIKPEMITKYLKTFAQVAENLFDERTARQIQPLVTRLQERGS